MRVSGDRQVAAGRIFLQDSAMILCHAHRFIFIKTTKTAGSSPEMTLTKYCGPDDIVTPMSPADERKRASLGYSGPRCPRPLVRNRSYGQGSGPGRLL